MKQIIFICSFVLTLSIAHGQVTYPIRADTVKIYTGSTVPGAGGELLLQNASRIVLNGLLTNINGRGNTEFRNLALTTSGNIPSGSILSITGQGSVALPWLKPYVDTLYLSAGNLLYQKNGTTYTVVLPAAPVYTASNYLTKTANNFTLGGTGAANTLLNAGTFNFSLQGTDASAGVSDFTLTAGTSANFKQSVTRGTTNSSIENFYNTVDIISTTTGSGNSLIRATPVQTSINLTSAAKTSTLSLSTGLMQVNDGINSVGLNYAGNYAANNLANDRWLTDKKYVDSSIIAAAGSGYTAGSLMTLNTNIFELGGTATRATALNLGLFGLDMQGGDNSGTSSEIQLNNLSSSNIIMNSGNATTTSSLSIDPTNIQLNNLSSGNTVRSQVNVGASKALLQYMTGIGGGSQAFTEIDMQSGGALLTDQIAFKGLRYAFNYGANNAGENQWLTDKRYVDSSIAAHTAPTYTAANMLTLSGTQFRLGGNATAATTLNAGTFPFTMVASPVGAGSVTFTLGNAGVATYEINAINGASQSNFSVSTSSAGFSSSTTGVGNSGVNVNAFGTVISTSDGTNTNTLNMGITQNLLDDAINSVGISYANDYSGNNLLNNRWIVDKEYVDNKIAGIRYGIRIMTATGNALSTDYTIIVNNGAAATITLPAAAGSLGQIIVIKKITGVALDVTIAGNGADLIDGIATKVLTLQNSSVILQSTGSEWEVLAAYAAATTL
jgi:hypothetical protein